MAQACERFMMDVTDSQLGPEQRCKICKQQKKMHQTAPFTKQNSQTGNLVAQLAQKFSQSQQTQSSPYQQYKKQLSNSEVPHIMAPKIVEQNSPPIIQMEKTNTTKEQIKQTNSIEISNPPMQFNQDIPPLARQNVEINISSQKIQQPTQEQSIPLTQSQPTQQPKRFEENIVSNKDPALKKADSDIIPEKEPQIQSIRRENVENNNQTNQNITPKKIEIAPTIIKSQPIVPPKVQQPKQLNIPMEGGVRDKAKSIALNFVPFGQPPPKIRSKSAQREPEQAQQIAEQLLERPAPKKNHKRKDENFITDE